MGVETPSGFLLVRVDRVDVIVDSVVFVMAVGRRRTVDLPVSVSQEIRLRGDCDDGNLFSYRLLNTKGVVHYASAIRMSETVLDERVCNELNESLIGEGQPL